MNVILYRIPHLQYGKNNTINFADDTTRDVYFNSIADKLELEVKLSPNWIKNIWKLNNDITIYDEGRYPYSLYNYMMIDNGDRKYYFYITDYEELGNNQVKYHLVMDTLITYVTTPNAGVDIEAKDALILREHKNRFINGVPQFHKEIEKVDLIPKEISQEFKSVGQRSRMVLKEYGGDTTIINEESQILSFPLHFWEVYVENAAGLARNNIKTRVREGWSIQANGNVTFKMNDELNSTLILAPTNANRYYSINTGSYTTPGRSIQIHHVNNTKTIRDDITVISATGHWYFSDSGVDYDFGSSSINYESSILTAEFNGKLYYNHGISPDATGALISQSHQLLFDSTGYWESKKMDTINYSDPKILKIIELPYVPRLLNNDYVNGNKNSVFLELLKPIEMAHGNNLPFSNIEFDTTKVDKLRVKYNDPKLYHSQFNPYFLTWYNESILLRRENLININHTTLYSKLNDWDYTKVTIKVEGLKEQSVYELNKVIDMNNNIPLIDSKLDNYIQTTYQNDLKLMQLQESQATRNLQRQRTNLVTRTGAGAVGGFVAGNVVGAGVGAVGGLVTGIIDLKFAYEQAQEDQQARELQFANKMINLQNSMINISGMFADLNHLDDLDKIKIFEAKLNTTELDYLDKYFHLYGYQTLELKKPVLRTRKYFDYKQMIIDEVEEYAPVTEEVKMDIIDRFREGVTIYHTGYTSWSNFFDLTNQDDWKVSAGAAIFENNFDNISWITINEYNADIEATDWYKDGDDYVIDLGVEGYLTLKSNGEFEYSDHLTFFDLSFGYEEVIEPDFKQEKENWEVD